MMTIKKILSTSIQSKSESEKSHLDNSTKFFEKMFSCSCDTMVVMGDATEDGSIIFAKNSDRQMNEPLSIRYFPSSRNSIPTQLKTTYIEIDEVQENHGCILFSPSNLFGAEMGFNIHGLVVGNEALFTKVESSQEGLTGMDLVRLVLQRCSTSVEGKKTIISLLNQYNQGGNCGFRKSFFYQNSFLLVDRNEGWVIETVGKDYAAKRIEKGIYTISNRISFGGIETFDEYSPNLINRAIANGWCCSLEDFHFGRCYSGFSSNPKQLYNGLIKTYFSSSQSRQTKAKDFLQEKSGQINVKDLFQLLRDHHSSKHVNPIKGLTNIDICMHSSFGPIKFNQTTGSLISILPKTNHRLPLHYVTCSSSPCLAIYKPIWLHSTIKPPKFLLDDQTSSSCTYSPNSLWWKSEIINRNLAKFYRQLIEQIRGERDSLEEHLVSQSDQLSSIEVSDQQRNHFTGVAFEQVCLILIKFSKTMFYCLFFQGGSIG